MMKFKSIWIGRENPNQIWTKNLSFPPLCPLPKPKPVHLSFSEGNFGSCISSNSCAFCLTPNADCIERTRDMSRTNWFINSSIWTSFSNLDTLNPNLGISRHGPWSCWLTLGKSCATWDWNYWVGSLEWGRVLVQEGPGWVDAMQLRFESSVFHWWFYEVERKGRESKYWLCSLCKKTYIFKPKEGNANANVNGVKMVSVYLLWSYAQVLDIGNFSIPIL